MIHRPSDLASYFEHGSEYSGPIRGEEFLDQLSNYQLSRRALLHGLTSQLLYWY
jgi:hypothetical protein